MSTITTGRWKCTKCGTTVYSSSYERMMENTFTCPDGLHIWESLEK